MPLDRNPILRAIEAVRDAFQQGVHALSLFIFSTFGLSVCGYATELNRSMTISDACRLETAYTDRGGSHDDLAGPPLGLRHFRLRHILARRGGRRRSARETARGHLGRDREQQSGLRAVSGWVSITVVNWGVPGDVPVPADYDGDGKADPAVYRPDTGFWLIAKSATSYTTAISVQWGVQALGDVPMPADFDGDGRADPTIYRPGTGQWFIARSENNYTTFTVVQWGNQAAGDVPVREK
jgi:hypothetical protein